MSSVNVGERIRQLRLGLGISVRALAAKTGFSPSLISQAENGQVTPLLGRWSALPWLSGSALESFLRSQRPAPAVGASQPSSEAHQHLVAGLDRGTRSPG